MIIEVYQNGSCCHYTHFNNLTCYNNTNFKLLIVDKMTSGAADILNRQRNIERLQTTTHYLDRPRHKRK